MKPYQSVLDKINKIRDQFGLVPLLDLPKGRRHASNSCPIAKALIEIDEDVEVNPDNIQFYSLTSESKHKIAKVLGDDDWSPDNDYVALTGDMIDFIGKFDYGDYSELVYKGE